MQQCVAMETFPFSQRNSIYIRMHWGKNCKRKTTRDTHHFEAFHIWHIVHTVSKLIKIVSFIKYYKRYISVNWMNLDSKSPHNRPYFGIFNALLSTQIVNVARFARNIEWDFLCDFQTLWLQSGQRWKAFFNSSSKVFWCFVLTKHSLTSNSNSLKLVIFWPNRRPK